MKEFLLAGAVVAVLALFVAQTAGGGAGRSVLPAVSEGFVPNQRVTAVPAEEADGGFLPDFGSQSYL